MDTSQIFVTIGGMVLILFVLVFFFGPRKSATAHESRGVQTVQVLVKGGYAPDLIEVQVGRPVRLVFRREENNSCTEEVVFSDFGIVRRLPQNESVPIEFTPDKPGEFIFHCAMNMVRGRLIVRP